MKLITFFTDHPAAGIALAVWMLVVFVRWLASGTEKGLARLFTTLAALGCCGLLAQNLFAVVVHHRVW
jgi:hypothetical protein